MGLLRRRRFLWPVSQKAASIGAVSRGRPWGAHWTAGNCAAVVVGAGTGSEFTQYAAGWRRERAGASAYVAAAVRSFDVGFRAQSPEPQIPGRDVISAPERQGAHASLAVAVPGAWTAASVGGRVRIGARPCRLANPNHRRHTATPGRGGASASRQPRLSAAAAGGAQRPHARRTANRGRASRRWGSAIAGANRTFCRTRRAANSS
jgi:hypothetical protein